MHPTLDPHYVYIDENFCTLCWQESIDNGRYPIKTKTVCVRDKEKSIVHICDLHLLLMVELLFQKE